MRIDRLRVQNFRCFNDREWTFSPGCTVLIGDNGAGKSTVLEALKFVLGAFLLGIAGGEGTSLKEKHFRYEIQWLPDRVYRHIYSPIIIHAFGDVNNTSSEWTRDCPDIKRSTRYRSVSGTSPKDFAAQLQKRAREGDISATFPLLVFYGAGRLFQQKQERKTRPTTPQERTYAYNAVLAAESDFDYQLAWWVSRIFANKREIRGTPLLDGLYETVLKTLGVEWTELRFDLELEQVLVQTPAGVWHSLTSLSDGQRCVLAMGLDMAYRCIVLNPGFRSDAPQQTGGVVLIDEIDLHLHPNWQRAIVGNLRRAFPNVQFIVTTHSPIILQNLDATIDCVINLSDATHYSIEDYADQPVEDVYINQGYKEPHLSTQRQEMIAAAEAYYRLLKQAKTAQPRELEQLKRNMDTLALPYHDNEAYIAFLNMERRAELGDRA